MDYVADDMRTFGFAVWNIEYRRLGEAGGGYPGTFLDVAQGIDALKTLTPTYDLDLKHIVAIGHSAGGQLALWAAARAHLPLSSLLYERDPLPIETVVSLAGIDDLAAYRNSGEDACGGPHTIDALVGGSSASRADVYSDTSPTALLPIGVRQFVVSGDRDEIVPPRIGRDYAGKAKVAGDDVRLIEITNAGHFDLIDPQSKAWRQVRQIVEALQR
jgi:acetyl esterase/lipase